MLLFYFCFALLGGAPFFFTVVADPHSCSRDDSSKDTTCSVKKFRRKFWRESPSTVASFPGHYPANHCRISNVYFDSKRKRFHVGVDDLSDLDACYGTRQIWDFSSKPINSSSTTLDSNREHDNFCDQIFETGHVFTTYYYHGSNYFHLHYDTALPLFYQLHHHQQIKSRNILFMPSVELERGKGTDWNTKAFLDETTYWNRMIQVVQLEFTQIYSHEMDGQILTDPHKVVPLDERLVAMEKTFCFKEIYFGAPKFDASDSAIISGFSSFIKSRLKIALGEGSPTNNLLKSVGLIQRVGRRRILNEGHLLSALDQYANVQLVNFTGIPLERQIEQVQHFDVLVGVNGAGLMNALYLPNHSVAVQLVPYMAQLNHKEYSVLLKARGPYLDWHNSYSNLTRSIPGDIFNNNPDTFVHVEEFVALIKEAMKLSNNRSH